LTHPGVEIGNGVSLDTDPCGKVRVLRLDRRGSRTAFPDMGRHELAWGVLQMPYLRS
jgi:hypothetical protein